MNIISLFPTAIGDFSDFITESERLELFENIKNISHHPHDQLTGNGFSTHTLQNDFMSKTIKDRIQSTANEYAKFYGLQSVKVGGMWSNIQHSGSCLNEHTHPNSIVSGSLYINVDETCKLYFHNPNPYNGFTQYDKTNDFNYQFVWINVKNCQLILFPSWLKHGKNNEVNMMDDRVVVSFNCNYDNKDLIKI